MLTVSLGRSFMARNFNTFRNRTVRGYLARILPKKWQLKAARAYCINRYVGSSVDIDKILSPEERNVFEEVSEQFAKNVLGLR